MGTLSNRDGYTTEGLKRDIVLDMAGFLALQPWLEAGLVQPMPSFAVLEESLRERISGFADQDHDDEEWGSLKGALRNEDLGLEGEALIQVLEHLIKPIARQRIMVESGGARTAVLKLLLRGTSYTVGKGFFGAALTDSSPTTDMTYFWRLFGLWVSKRAHLLVQTGDLRREVWEWMRREVKAGRAWHQLKVEKLGALMKLAPEETIKIRGSSKYSLASFRRTLWRAVEEIELAKLGDEKEFQEVMSQVWRGVENEADDVERELKYLKLKAGASAAPTPLTLVLGFTPFPLNLLGMVLGGVQVTEFLRFLLERGKQKERSGYFLLKLREA